jgi:IS30 family transposase
MLERPWHSISTNFITDLPDSNGFNSILVIVDQASKQGIFISCDKTITSMELAHLFLIHIFSKYRVPTHVTSDHGKEFVTQFMRSLGELLDIDFHYTSGYHPEADGQMEQANQTLEQYL